MKCRRILGLAALFILFSTLPAVSQRHLDPLTDHEVNLLRETAQEPVPRLRLMVKFTRERVTQIDGILADPKASAEKIDEVAELLDDIAALVDEIDDNLSSYDNKGSELRPALRDVIKLDTELKAKFTSMKEHAQPDQMRVISVALASAADSVNSSAESANGMLADQNAKKGIEKIDKKQEKEERKAAKEREKSPPPDYTGMGGIGREGR